MAVRRSLAHRGDQRLDPIHVDGGAEVAIDLERRPYNGSISDRERLGSALDGEAAPDKEGDLGTCRFDGAQVIERSGRSGAAT